MKELSIEEKARRYDRAIERANSLLSDNQLGNAWIYKLLPELKESENENIDEKVRKALIKLVTNHASMDLFIEYDIHLDEALSWLEKQGDKDKLIQELEEYKVKYTQEVLEKHMNSMNNKDDERLKKTTIAFLKDFADKGYENAVECIAWLEKQGEQNYKIIKGKNYFCIKTHNYAGVEWIKGTNYYASDNYTLVNKGCECYCPEYSKEEHNNLFEEVKYDSCVEKQGEQNHANKCKPKFKVGDKIIENNEFGIVGGEITDIDDTHYELDNGCRYIPISHQDNYKLAKQTLVEWSEEDKTYLDHIITAIKSYYTDDKGKENPWREELLRWLESLEERYTWKPSDEQMEQLGWIAEQNEHNLIGKELMTLYKDLKKLREE